MVVGIKIIMNLWYSESQKIYVKHATIGRQGTIHDQSLVTLGQVTSEVRKLCCWATKEYNPDEI